MPHWISNNPQELFDHVVLKLAEQGRKSGQVDDDTKKFMCRYVSGDGCRCAASWCLTDTGLKAAHEDRSIRSLVNAGYIDAPINLDLIIDLQQAHDRAGTRRGFRAKMEIIARERKLEVTTLEAVLTAQWCADGDWSPAGEDTTDL